MNDAAEITPLRDLQMQSHLRAWRKTKGYSQEHLGHILQTNRTTVSRWEKLEMPISTAQLANIAKIYGVSTTQLISAPEEAELVATLDKVQSIMQSLDQATVDKWIAIGEALARK